MKSITRIWIFVILFFFVMFAIQFVQKNKENPLSKKVYEIVDGKKVEKNEVKEDVKKENVKVEKEKVEKPEEIDYSVIKPNELGDIMVLMYHGLTEDVTKNVYRRTIADFKADLNYFYENNYVPISMKEFTTGAIDVPAGKTPIVITFDDGLDTSFSLVKNPEGKFEVKKNTALEIMESFKKEHKDFKSKAIFYINGNNNPFLGAGTVDEKLKYLVNLGYEISNHTYSHINLGTAKKDDIVKELGIVNNLIINSLGNDYLADTIALPYGALPKDDLIDYMKNGMYEGNEYSYKIAFKAGPSSKFYPYYHAQYKDYNAPRARANDSEDGDMGYYLRFYEKNPNQKFISDGNKNRISIPKEYEKNINKDKIKELELYLY